MQNKRLFFYIPVNYFKGFGFTTVYQTHIKLHGNVFGNLYYIRKKVGHISTIIIIIHFFKFFFNCLIG